MKKLDSVRTWVEVDKKAIAHNYRVFRKLLNKKTLFLAVVKSNAYGHNLLEFAPEMQRLGADWLGVDSLVEARSARSVGVKIPILVQGFTLPSLYEEARTKGISITISSFAQLEQVRKLRPAKKILKIHIKVDTGMHRQGFQLVDAKKLLHMLALSKGKTYVVEGLYTHFAEAKDPRSGDATRRQIKEFEEWITLFANSGLHPLKHASATGATLLYPQAHFDMVRVGIGCYGLWPSSEAERFMGHKVTLKPVLTWKAVVSEVKLVKSGERVGYDLTERLNRNTTLAVIPVGYWHGMSRLASSKGRVLIKGKSARIVGRVSMDMIVVDVTDIHNVEMGDEVVLIGRQGKAEIKAGEIAQFSATTHYEIVTRLNPLMQKFYI